MEVYYTDKAYRDDGIRDPMRWSRFSGLRFVLGGSALVLVAVLASGSDGEARVRGVAVDTAAQVASTAVVTAREAALRRADPGD